MEEKVIREFQVIETEEGYRIEMKGDKAMLRQMLFGGRGRGFGAFRPPMPPIPPEPPFPGEPFERHHGHHDDHEHHSHDRRGRHFGSRWGAAWGYDLGPWWDQDVPDDGSEMDEPSAEA